MEKRVKRIACILLLIMSFIYGTALAVNSRFPDVDSEASDALAVNELADLGIIKGDENGKFNPYASITRAEFAAIMVRMLGMEDE